MKNKQMVMEYPAGIKWTKQRKDVYQILTGADGPLSAVEIYNRIIQTEADASYALSTIYRILEAFEAKDLVIKSTLMNNETALYEWNHGGHTHYAICLTCHKKVPLKSCPFEHMRLPETGDDFEVTGHRVEVYGYCKNCQRV